MEDGTSIINRPAGITRYSDDGIRRSPLAKRAQKAKRRRQEKALQVARLELEKAAFDQQDSILAEEDRLREAEQMMAFAELVHYDLCPPPGPFD